LYRQEVEAVQTFCRQEWRWGRGQFFLDVEQMSFMDWNAAPATLALGSET